MLVGKHQDDGAQGSVTIHVELDTLAGLGHSTGDLAGFGPVIADIARQTTAELINGRWEYVVTDQGQPIATGTTSRRPTASMTRQIRARYRTCVFPGCRTPAEDCDMDHIVPWAQDGATAVCNNSPGCRHDHRIRHQWNWTYQRLPSGHHQWTSPLGRIYTTKPEPRQRLRSKPPQDEPP